MTPADALLTDQVAIVTGAGQGIGEGIAIAFANFGAHVVIAEKNAQTGPDVAQSIRQIGRKSLFVKTDVRKLDQVQAMVDETMQTFGRVDILVNNAGGLRPSSFMDMEPEDWHKQVALNFDGLFGPTRAVVKKMLAAGSGGSIINIASIEAFRAIPDMSAIYGACKAGMVNFTKTLSLELADKGIRVNAIAPDVFPTVGTEKFMRPGDMEAFSRAIPMGRVGTVDECGGVAVFLASKLSSYVTGTTIHVDGGTMAAGGWTRRPDMKWSLTHPMEAYRQAG